MSSKYAIPRTKRQEAQEKSHHVTRIMEDYLEPLAVRLDAYADARLVQTFFHLIRTIIEARSQSPGLLISELGSLLLSGRQAVAGGKRIHRLLSSQKWDEELIKEFQWAQAQEYYKKQKEGEQLFVIWDGSVVEKPESQKAEDLCAVRSSKAARRKKTRKGSFNQPGGRAIVVRGYEWTACVMAGKKGKPSLAMMEFWSRKGPEATTEKREVERMLSKVAGTWGRKVLHVFDRGYAGGPWLEMMKRNHVDFLIRWKKGHHFFDENGEEKALSQIGKSKRSKDHRMIWDALKHEERKTGIAVAQVRHASYSGELWVVIVRRGGEPWYLVTNRRIETEQQAWEMYTAYCRRWQVETVFRYEKSELALETVRVWKREKRKKFFHIISLVHSLLFHFLDEEYKEMITWLLNEYCHRTGKKQKEAKVPLYRLRWALSRFWQEMRPLFLFAFRIQPSIASNRGSNVRSQNSG